MLAQSGFWHETEQDLVVIPSISFAPLQLAKINGIEHYEERMLYHLFHLRHSRNSRILYLTSLPLDPAILEYYVALIADSISDSPNYSQDRSREDVFLDIKSRVLFLSAYDGTKLISLTDKIMSKPRILKRIKQFINSKLSPDVSTYLSVYRGTETEFKIGNILKLPVHAADSSLLFWGGKAGSRSIFRDVNVPHCDGTYRPDTNVDAIIQKIIATCERNPASKKGMLKLDEGFSGKGNALVNLEKVQEAIQNNSENITEQVKDALENAKFFGESECWASYSKQIALIGAIFELFVEIKETDLMTTSPSVQVYIDLNGNVEVVSTHEQILQDQHYLGCEFPAYRPYREEIANYSFKIGLFLADKGVTGHFGVDFLCVQNTFTAPSQLDSCEKSDEKYGVLTDWSIYAIEINLRMTGTTHPQMTLRMLTDGELLNSGIFVTSSNEPCFYVSYDLACESCFKRLIPLDLLDIIQKCKWKYNHSTKSGAVFHMLGSISEHGSLGFTCIGRSRDHALSIFENIRLLLISEAQKGLSDL